MKCRPGAPIGSIASTPPRLCSSDTTKWAHLDSFGLPGPVAWASTGRHQELVDTSRLLLNQTTLGLVVGFFGHNLESQFGRLLS